MWACFYCFWVTWWWKRMGCVGSSLSFGELHTVSTKATLFHYPWHRLDASLCLTFPVLANTWYCLLLVLSWFLFFSCFSHKDGCGVLMTDDNLCPFWGICVPSLINICCHLVVLWMLSIFILVFKVIKTFYVCLCIWAFMFMCAYGFHSFGPTVFSWYVMPPPCLIAVGSQ